MVQFRKSTKIGPIRVTASKRGLGVSAGAGPVRIGRGSDGRYRRTVRVPGTGLYDTKVIGGASKKAAVSAQPASQSKKVYSAGENAVGWVFLTAISVALLVWAISSGGWLAITLAVLFMLFCVLAMIGSVGEARGKKDAKPVVPVILMEPSMPGWFPDPYEPTRQRWWNGNMWTTDTRWPH